MQNFIGGEDKPVGNVTIGTDHKPICVPCNAPIIILGKTSKIATKKLYILELAVHNNIPAGDVVNRCYVTPKVGQVLVILINTTN